jgi:hypothetical protein
MPASVEGANGKALLAAAQDRKQGGEGDPTDELPCREAATWSIGSRRSRAQPQPLRLPSAGPLSVLLGRVGSTGLRAGYPRAGYRRMASTSRSSSLFMQVPIVGGGIVDGHGPPSRRPHTNGEAPGSRPRPRRGMCTAAARRGARGWRTPHGEGDSDGRVQRGHHSAWMTFHRANRTWRCQLRGWSPRLDQRAAQCAEVRSFSVLGQRVRHHLLPREPPKLVAPRVQKHQDLPVEEGV